VHTPVLTDISIEWNGLPVTDVMPAKPLDLFTAKPLVISGRYTMPAVGTLRLRGLRAGKPFQREIRVNLPSQEEENRALAQLWARTKVDDLMSQDWKGMQSGSPSTDVREQITQLGLDYRLMTQFTSFIAVEEQTVVEGGVSRTVHVPVEMPHGVSPEGVFGETKEQSVAYASGSGRAGGVSGGGMFVMRKAAPGILTANEAVQLGATPPPMSAGDASKTRINGQPQKKDERDRPENQAKRRATLESKLHPALLAAYDCWQRSGGKGNCAGVKNGKVQIKLWLLSQTPQLKQELATLGFNASSKAGNVVARDLAVAGEIAIEKLPALAEVAGVKLIALQK
jgi:Ca-activated chloride channel family protein